ncbi:hypothetical protein BST81_12115 [Leptolyngbya sp. 'hensonii']|uniref:SH3 domain-containing protein n=1 Tax=Leptolyngbya sp. 'hensonii' TaxID=1922337 RepID=UPI00094FC371|nr:SH3 domain-containing protein [Leptolyngbya sp. 'hensonii']OLP17809.1 hypothetical protein BST81_12115 [Leptolyngbya sp. 'hensonii']
MSKTLTMMKRLTGKFVLAVAATAVVLVGSVFPALAGEGILKADDPKAQINLRESASTSSRSLGYGLVGDRVTTLDQVKGTDGYVWYKVKFPKSGSVGWVRGDFVQVVTPEGILQAEDPQAQINLRQDANPNSTKLGYGVVGDRVLILGSKKGTDNYTWYKVKFPKSGAVGWIRGTFLRVTQ